MTDPCPMGDGDGDGDGDRIMVAEQSGERKWRATWKNEKSAFDAEWVVPSAAVFVLGDNRDEAKDSRSFGFVPLNDLVGRARQIWFSMGPSGVRWGRLGQVIE